MLNNMLNLYMSNMLPDRSNITFVYYPYNSHQDMDMFL